MDQSNTQSSGSRILGISILIWDIIVLLIKLNYIFIISLVRCIIPPKETSVAGEKVLITGTGHGIGKELARQYGELGAEVICVDINPKTNQETVDELKRRGILAHAYECDVSKRENVLELARKVKAEVGDVTILVNNAGIMKCKRLQDHTPADYIGTFEINVFAHIWLLEVFLPSMIKKNQGHVLAIASGAGFFAFPYAQAYCASKFAVMGLMEATEIELRQQGINVKFTTICPNITTTGLCTSYKIRFPLIFPELSPAYVAAKAINAQRRGYKEISIPFHNRPGINVLRLLPEKAHELLYDFLDTGIVLKD